MTTPEADPPFERTITRLRRIQFRLLLIGGPLFVLTPLIVGFSVPAGAGWMRWFWVVPVTILAVALALVVATASAERRRWLKHVREIAQLDLEASARASDEGVQDS